MRYLGLSLLLHGLLLAPLIQLESKTLVTNPIFEVELKAPKRRDFKLESLGIGYDRPRTIRPGFLSNRDAFQGALGQMASADNYIERIEALVGPGWRIQVSKRVRELIKQKRAYRCETCYRVLLNSSGTPIEVTRVQSCPDAEISQASEKSLDRNFPPPPADLMENEKLLLEWCFEVK